MNNGDNNREYQKPQYATYNAFGRVAMIKGINVPLMPALIIFTFSIVGPLLTNPLLGIGCFVFPIIGIPALVFLRVKCENDDNAIRIFILEMKCVCKRSLYSMFGKTLTFFPINYGRKKHDAERYFKKG